MRKSIECGHSSPTSDLINLIKAADRGQRGEAGGAGAQGLMPARATARVTGDHHVFQLFTTQAPVEFWPKRTAMPRPKVSPYIQILHCQGRGVDAPQVCNLTASALPTSRLYPSHSS